jgi:hypothetical protein
MSENTESDAGEPAAEAREEKPDWVQSGSRVNVAFDKMKDGEPSVSDNNNDEKTGTYQEDVTAPAATAEDDNTEVKKKKKVEHVEAVRLFELVRDHILLSKFDV